MKVEIEQLFSDIEFKDIILEKWIAQYHKKGNLQSNTKQAITKALLKKYWNIRISQKFLQLF